MAVLTGAGASERSALRLIGLSRSSWRYRTHPRDRVSNPVPHAQRGGKHWLSPQEQAAILDRIQEAFQAQISVYEAFYAALDAGDPIASLSSWHRLARRLEPQRPSHRKAQQRSSAIPELTTNQALQLWSWDISKLPLPLRGEYLEFYVVIDVFSRYIVGWRVEETESDELAKEMMEQAFAAEGATPQVIHSDGGASMRSNTLLEFYDELSIATTKNRPRVSNDNPYSEAAFKTAKYRPEYPQTFNTLDQAREWARQFVTWYNDQHAHSGLEGHTPASIHHDTWRPVHHARQATLDALYEAHPERFTRGRPQLKTPLAAATINQPKTKKRLQTG